MVALSRRNLFKATAAAGAGAVVLPGTAVAGPLAMDGDPAPGYVEDAESEARNTRRRS